MSLDPTALDTPERILAYCQKAGLIQGNSTDIESLIRGNPELTLDFEDIGEFDAFIEKLDPSRFRIVVNRGHPKTRQRFSMAHEYVHYQMHRPEIDSMPSGERILHRSEERDRVEYLANDYAGQILMPETVFRVVAAIKKGDVNAIAAEFNVSSLAVRFRAKTLGIAGHGL